MSTEDVIDAEKAAMAKFRAFVRENAAELRLVAHWGDGYAGYLAQVICSELGIERTPSAVRTKAIISRSLAKQVFERDAYRCVECGGHHDLTCDHVIPESKGGPTTLENLQTMCRRCNCRKGAR